MAAASICILLMLCSIGHCLSSDDCSSPDCAVLKLTNQDKIIEKLRVGKVYCLKPINPWSFKGLCHIWCYYHVFINTTSKEAVLIIGNSSLSVTESTWSKQTESLTSPYERYCFGVKSSDISSKSTIVFEKTRTQIKFPLLLIVGILLYIIAPYLMKNVTFYYSGGIFIGIIASLLILLYIFSKFVPKKNLLGLGILVGGYSFTGYIIHWVFTQGMEFVIKNWLYLLIYVVTAGLISFAVLYRMGPAHPRSIQLIQWFLQLIGLILVFLSFHQLISVSLAAVIVILSFFNMPLWMSTKLWSLFQKIFCCLNPFFRLLKKPRRMLTKEEYEEQGRIETEKALMSLKKLCRNSTDFWERNLNNLKDQRKFLDFLSGKDHVTEKEREVHEAEYSCAYYDTSSSSGASDDEYTSETPSPYLSSQNSSFTSNSYSPDYY